MPRAPRSASANPDPDGHHPSHSGRAPGHAEATLERFAPVVARGDVEILLLGCGRRMGILPPALRQGLRASGIVVDAMDTGAACRTYNVLLAEERRVAAALIGIG